MFIKNFNSIIFKHKLNFIYYYEKFYQPYELLKYKVDNCYNICGKEFFKIKIKVNYNNKNYKKICFLHLSEANIIVV